MQEHEHVINLLKEAKQSALRGDVIKLRQLSDQTIHSSAIHQDTDNILIAIVIYSLSKFLERRSKFSDKEFNNYLNYYIKTIDESIIYIEKNNCQSFRKKIESLTESGGLEANFKESAREVFRKARINKASRVYEHGISMEATAKLLGISLWELAEYSGQTGISDVKYNKTIGVKERIKYVMEIFE